MTWVGWVAVGFGVIGTACGIRCYIELWRWAKQCQRAQITVAYNQRVRLTASLTEWLGWVNQLPEDTNGRVVFHQHKMSVSILRRKPITDAKTTVKTIRHSRNSRNSRKAAA